jgi:hypothetical protein
MKKNSLLMLLCCLIPVAAIAAFLFFGLSWRYMLFAIAISFPLLHFLAMQDSCCSSHTSQEKSNEKGVN